MSGSVPQGAARAASVLGRIAGALSWTCGALSATLILGAFAITIYAVFMRYVLSMAPLWYDEVTGWLLVALVSFGAAEAYRRGDHIAIDLLSGKLRGKAGKAQRLFADLAVLVLAVVLFLSTWEAIAFARMFGSFTSGNIEIESWLPQLPLLVAAGMLGLVAVARFLQTLTGQET
ncbi:TRAP transporter small permease [Antarctobacter sp.]|uniref:TRAP transporter small permease n=1 Tax=Antarctobacter sp. TaxID=1872577 RepID=UPI003A90E546